MNIESLAKKIELFTELVISSGLKRDLEGYIASIAPAQNRSNLALFKEISNNVQNSLASLQNTDLAESLSILLPDNNPVPFTTEDHLKIISDLINNKEIAAPDYFRQLNQFLNNLKNQIDSNELKLKALLEVFNVYISKSQFKPNEEQQAVLSVIFKDDSTITSLKEFSKSLHRWNTTFHVYHLLLRSSPPKEIELVTIQNGSIDVVVNIDIEVAIDFVELLKLGFEVYGGYLLYKSKVGEIVKTYFGNKVLIKQEEEREKEMIENISKAVSQKLLEQHEKSKKEDDKVDNTSIDTKVKTITEVITDHIVKGNDVKLLSAPTETPEIKENSESANKQSAINRSLIKSLPPEEKIKLIERFKIEDKPEDK